MMNKKYIITLLCVCSISAIYSQQVVKGNLLDENLNKVISLIDGTDMNLGELDSENITLNELESNQSGSAELEISYLSNSKITFSLEEGGGQNYTVILDNGVFSIPNSTPLVSNESYSTGDKFKIERCADGVTIYKNGASFYNFSSAGLTQSIVSKINVESASLEGTNNPLIKLTFPILTGCGGTGTPQPEEGTFTVLKKKLDGNYTVAPPVGLTSQPKLYFTFPHDYNEVASEKITYTVRNWKNESIITGDLPYVYGANWKSLSFPNPNFPNNGPEKYYILEVANVSKGETYYLRFKSIDLQSSTF